MPYSLKSDIVPYPRLDQVVYNLSSCYFKNYVNIIRPSVPSIQAAYFIQDFNQNSVLISLLSYACRMLGPSHLPGTENSRNI
jgi:hypothetical protein